MKRILSLLLGIIAFFANGSTYAQTFYSADDFLIRLKTHRAEIYKELNLTPDQIQKVQKLDSEFYADIQPEFSNISLMIKKIQDIANSNNCTKKHIDLVKREFDNTDRNIEALKKSYETEFKTILTKNQNKKYKQAKKLKRSELKKEIQELRKNRKQE